MWSTLGVRSWRFVAAATALSATSLVGDRAKCESGRVGDLRKEVIGNYENRLRRHSPPEKLFAYFASVPAKDVYKDAARNEMLMTPEDFVRSLVLFTGELDQRALGSSNAQFALGRNSEIPERARTEYKQLCEKIAESARTKGDSKEIRKQFRCLRRRYLFDFHDHAKILEELQISNADFYRDDSFVQLVDSDGDGFISFEEYLLFTSLLSIPRNQLKLVFRLIDSSHDGELDRAEFLRALKWISKCGHLSGRALDVMSRVEKKFDFIVEKFFDKKETIKFKDFERFLDKLHENITELEFEIFDPNCRGFITPSAFVFYLAAAHTLPSHRDAVLKTGQQLLEAESKMSVEELSSEGISLESFQRFGNFLVHLDELQVAMDLLLALEDENGGISLDGFMSCVQSVSSRKTHRIPRQIASLLFRVLDENHDSLLSKEELMSLLNAKRGAGLRRADSHARLFLKEKLCSLCE